MPLPKLLDGPVRDARHADVLLELAFLMTAVDGRLADEEVAAFAEIASIVRGAQVSESDVKALVVGFGVADDKEAIAARVRAIAPTLPADLREAAFKVAMALALVDRDASPHEDVLMGVFFEALGLEEARADALAAEIRKSFA